MDLNSFIFLVAILPSVKISCERLYDREECYINTVKGVQERCSKFLTKGLSFLKSWKRKYLRRKKNFENIVDELRFRFFIF